MPVSNWTPPAISDLPQSWSSIPRISLDVETKDPDLYELGCGARRPGCHVVGFCLGFDFGTGPANYRTYYLPIRHEDGGNLPVDQVLRYMRGNLPTYKGRITGAELSYDTDYCLQEGIDLDMQHSWHDVATDASLIWEYHKGYGLDAMAVRHKLPPKDERTLRAAASFYGADNPKSILYRLHSKYVGPYGEHDALLPLLIDDIQRPVLRDMNLTNASDLEAAVLPVTVAMRRWGIRIDQDALARVEQWTNTKQAAYIAQFKHASGLDVSLDNLRSPFDLNQIIVDLGLPALPMTRRLNKVTQQYEDGQPSTEAKTLKSYRDPRLSLLVEAKKLDKIKTTYIPSIHEYMVNGRIYGTLKSVRGNRDGATDTDDEDSAGTVSRRFSHVHPNLGNQPNPTRDEDDALRVEMGTRWRSIFVPDEGAQWGLADFSQQEPRWIVNDAALFGFDGAREMMLRYHNDPRTGFHKETAKITALPGGPAKICGLAKAYGAGKARTALQLEDKMLELNADYKSGKLPTPEGWMWLPPGWRANVQAYYTPEDRWIPPNKCVGDPYWQAAPECVAIIDRMDERAPFIKQWARKASKTAEQLGRILLIDGGQAHFEYNESEGKYKDSHKAGNRRAQGNGAIQVKLFMVAVHREKLTPQMCVHDDLSRSVSGAREMKIYKEIGENVVEFVGQLNGRTPEKYVEDFHRNPARYKSVVPWLVKVKLGYSYGTADSTEVEVA